MNEFEDRVEDDPKRVLAELTAIVAVAGALGLALWRSNESASAAAVAALMAVGTVILFHRNSRSEPDPVVRGIVGASAAARVVAGVIRFHANVGAFGGQRGYRSIDSAAAAISAQVRSGSFLPGGIHSLTGTRLVELVVGYIYVIVGHSLVGATILFAWLGFAGSYLFLEAVRLAYPRADRRLYAIAVFVFPSLLLGTVVLGVTALIVFALGLATFGVASLYTLRPIGWAPLAVGLGLTALLHPGVALCLLAAGLAGYLAALPGRRSLGRPRQLVGVAVVIGIMAVVAIAGGVSTPLVDVPGAVLTVLFRPIVFEIGGVDEAIAALEALLVVVGLVLALHAIAPVLRTRVALLWFSIAFTVVYIAGYATYGPPATLDATRALMLPFFAVLVAAPRTTRSRGAKMTAAIAGAAGA